MRNLFLISTALLFFVHVSDLYSQQSSGTVVIKVEPESVKDAAKPVIKLIERSSRAVVQEVKATIPNAIVIHDVPFASYDVVLSDGSKTIDSRRITVSSRVDVEVVLGTLRKIEAGEVSVEGSNISDIPVSTRSFYTEKQIADIPSVSGSKKMEAILLSTPGSVPDEDGRMHFRGEDAQLQYVVDGIPITLNQTRIYSSLFNANLIKSADIQRGGLNAEYGVATSAIVSINTKSGFDKPLFADGSVSIGSFGTMDRTASVGGNIDGKVALFLSYASGETDRYLDPIHGFEPNHAAGYTHNYFGKADILLGDNMDLVLLGSRNLASFGIPNGLERIPAQDQRQSLNDYMFAARLNISFNNTSALSILGYKRRSESENTSGGLMQIISAADSVKAVSENEQFFIGGHRIDESTGGQVEFSWNADWLDLKHNFKFGAGGESYPLSEFFTFAVTNPALSNPDSSGGDDRYLPYDITKGGHPFLVDQSKTGKRISAFAQDQFTTGDWSFSAGLRFDMFSLLEDESSMSPRIGAGYKVNNDLSLRLSYSRNVTQAPLEYILVSSSDAARALVGTEQGTTPINVMSEKAHVIELGATYRFNDNLDLDFAGYGKLIDNFIVKVELGSSGVIFPVNLKNGMVLGGELQLNLHNWNNISARLGFTTCMSVGLKPEDGSSPIAAGLILGEEGENYSHPFAGEDQFKTEHNQLLTGTLNVNYDHPSGFFALLGSRFDSGLPFDLEKGGVGLTPEEARVELQRRGYSNDVIDLLNLEAEQEPGKGISPDKSVAPHFLVDIGAGFDFTKDLGIPVKIAATVSNVLDTKYLYKFESSFGGTHFGVPRAYSLTLQVKI